MNVLRIIALMFMPRRIVRKPFACIRVRQAIDMVETRPDHFEMA